MPPPKKLDLIPDEFRDWLKTALEKRGFAEIEDVTAELNDKLEEADLGMTIGKTAVGTFSKALKDQRDAFSIADTLLAEMDIEQETDLHRALVHMIATSAIHMIKAVREGDGNLSPQDLMNLGRMLQSLMSSSGMREKLLASERERIAKEAREAQIAEMKGKLDDAEAQGGTLAEAALAAREVLGFE